MFLRAGIGGGGSEGAGMDGGAPREGGGPSGGGGEGEPEWSEDEEGVLGTLFRGLWDWNWVPWDCGLFNWNRLPWELDLGMLLLLTGGEGDEAPHILAASAIGSYLGAATGGGVVGDGEDEDCDLGGGCEVGGGCGSVRDRSRRS